MCRLKGEGGRCYYHAQINYQTAKRKTLTAAKKSALEAGVEIDQDGQQRLNQRNQNLLIQATTGINVLMQRKKLIENAAFDEYEQDRKSGELVVEQHETAEQQFEDLQDMLRLLIDKQGEPRQALKTDVKSMGLVDHPDGRKIMKDVAFAKLQEREYQRLMRVLGPDNVLTQEAGVAANSAKVNVGVNNPSFHTPYHEYEEQYEAELSRLEAMSDRTPYYETMLELKRYEVSRLEQNRIRVERLNIQRSNDRMDRTHGETAILDEQLKDQEQALKEAKKLIRDKTPVFVPAAFEAYYSKWATSPEGKAFVDNETEKRTIMQATPGYLKEIKGKLENSIQMLEMQAMDPDVDMEKNRRTLERYRIKLNTVTKNLSALRNRKASRHSI